ncbi:hypothetical protein Q0Z83_069770 [Actinoplanes sichuanensis]|uniref:Gram-positive cocci surface proteins LPxTG domain-containing protein n=1 Tax=Actinoplanes sichuanensis TaxID=512349 RepID=A0ABW4ACY0_9ACTN|nr:hypothetical protein [Actinoplanes sichuanensis]BEL08786.1 hypothetical protein Q0Z83_069770 [Actinoplanes sichuanensis]
MPIALHALVAAALAVPAAPVAATTPRDCAGDFTARSRADLAKITVLDPGPLARGMPALADVRLASAEGTVDSAARPYRSIASGRHADARILGLPGGGAGARHAAPGPGGPDEKNLVAFHAAGLATTAAGRSTAYATWDDAYRCGKTGALTRAATMLSGLSVLDGAVNVGGRPTSLLRIGPTGSAQSATDLVDLRHGRVGVRSGAGVSLGDLSLFPGTPQEISIKVVNQPTLEVVAGSRPGETDVNYRPAVLRITTAGRPVQVLKDAGAAVSLGLLTGTAQGPPAALEVRFTLGEVRDGQRGRQVSAEASTVRVEVKLGMSHLLDVALGSLSVVACAPVATDHPQQPGPLRPSPLPDYPDDVDTDVGSSPSASPDVDHSPSASPDTSTPIDDVPVAVPSASDDIPGGTGGSGLALTGTDVTVFGFAGAGLILAGLLSLLLTRRRPTRD